MNAEANAITVIGNDVYIAGTINPTSDHPIAAYWKNGVLTKLTDGTSLAYGWSIAVNGNDVYVAGSIRNAYSSTIATYWKNGIPTKLLGGVLTDSYAIAVTGSDVYVVGVSDDGDNYNHAAYWKNGVITYLEKDSDACATDIIIKDNNLYISGYINQTALYWKNGVKTIIPTNNANNNSRTPTIALNDNNIYFAGFVNNDLSKSNILEKWYRYFTAWQCNGHNSDGSRRK